MDSAQPPSAAAANGSTQGDAAAAPLSTVDNKIAADLNVVVEKMDLLDSMIKPSGGSPPSSIQTSEALLTVIGFLEACAPRMIELVEAAAQGALSGSVLEQCLGVNDRLLKQLQEIDAMALTEPEASTTVASAPPPPVDDMAAFTLDDHEDDDAKKAAPVAGTKSTGEDDQDLFGDGKMPAASDDSDSKPAAAAAAPDAADVPDVADKDSFDDFFAERTAAQPKEGDE